MKKSLLALAALTAFAGAASAQSSVTLFGIIDVSARSVDNGSGGTIKSISTDGNASSRLGFRGLEDLGGGLRAGFWLEGAFGADTGCGGTSVGNTCPAVTWQRRATVSLIGNYGEVRLGRDYTPTFNNLANYDPFGYVGVASVANVRGGIFAAALAGTSVRANNTIAYFLPTLGGLYGQLQGAAGEGATGNKYAGGRLGYAAGPVNVGFAYGKTYKTGAMLDDLKTWNLGGSYDFGFLSLRAVYEKNDYGSANSKTTMLVGVIPFGASSIKIDYVKLSASTVAFSAKQFGLGYQYDMSKRTALYASYGRINNDGTPALGATFTSSGSGPAGIKGGENSTGYEFGIRHSF